MKRKIHELDKAIREKATELGLTFSNGPQTGEYPDPSGTLSEANGVVRGIYLFVVSEGK